MSTYLRASRRRGAVSLVAGAMLSAGFLAAGTPPSGAADDALVKAVAVAETTPSPKPMDSVDDMAIWVNPADPSKSLVVGADHQAHTLDVYDLSGERVSSTSIGNANNVDLRTDFSFAGTPAPLVAVGGDGQVDFYRLDTVAQKLVDVTKTAVSYTGTHGVCLYHSPKNGKFYAFAVNRGGTVGQFELSETAGEISGHKVRDINVNPRPPADATGNDALEGCVVDDAGGSLFVGEQDWNIWRYGADPGDSDDRVMVDKEESEGGNFARDVEGLAVVHSPYGNFLLASAQGRYDGQYGTFNVYQLEAPYTFLRRVRVEGGPNSDGCERTDGIEAAWGDLGSRFPQGIFICQDNSNTAPGPGNMNFKYVPLHDVVPFSGTPTTQPPTTQPPTIEPPATQPPTTEPPGDGPPATQPPVTKAPDGARSSGYWMLGATGKVYAFGDAAKHGEPSTPRRAVDLEPTPAGKGYWMVDAAGGVLPFGDATGLGRLEAGRLGAGEEVTSLSATPTGTGYWLFTNRGKVFAFGDAPVLGDMSAVKLNDPVLDSIATPTGKGYYMVAADGGIFSFGDARFFGSMGGQRLNAPVQSLVPDPDGAGYWLVASDGGVFAFQAGFRGSMGSSRLNAPVTGMVAFGNGYLMVGTDGGIFNFSDKKFAGSLGGNPPSEPITSVAALS